MSNAKETPRQKMISLMYLVLICLLALNVSREVLLGFVNINEGLENTNKHFAANTKTMMEAFREGIRQGRHEFEPYYQQACRAIGFTDSACTYIDSLKKQVIQYTEGAERADTLKLMHVEQLDNTDKPSFFLIGDDETKPSAGRFKALELKEQIIHMADSLQHIIDYMKLRDGLRLPDDDYHLLSTKIQSLKPQEHYVDAVGLSINWEIKQFYNQPLAAIVTNLSKLQSDIRNLEMQIIHVFAAASGKLSVKFDRMFARVIPQSHYVQAGTPFQADVLLSAYSSDFREDNLQFVLGNVDTSNGVLAPNAKLLRIENGSGKISIPTSGIGHQNINGWIKFRDGTGKYKYFSYTNEFIVARPVVAVSADKMNVFYAGVENPISVSAAGVAPTDLMVKVEGCGGEINGQGDGKYLLKVKNEGTCSVTVFKRNNGSLEKQGMPQVFRVKKIPSPPLRVNGKTVIGSVDMRVADAKNIRQVDVDRTGFDFNAPFKVTGFTLTMGGPGMTYETVFCENNQLNEKAIRALQRLRSGAKIYIEDVKVMAPDGPRDFATIKVNVK